MIATTQEHGPAAAAAMRDGSAVRFIMAHRLGRLLVDDPAAAEPHAAIVHYVFDRQGGFVTVLPADSPIADAIHRTGRALLSVHADHAWLPDWLTRRDDAAGGGKIWHVQADVVADLLPDADDVVDILRRQIAGVLAPLPQRDKSDPTVEAGYRLAEGLVGVRMLPVSVRAKWHTEQARA